MAADTDLRAQYEQLETDAPSPTQSTVPVNRGWSQIGEAVNGSHTPSAENSVQGYSHEDGWQPLQEEEHQTHGFELHTSGFNPAPSGFIESNSEDRPADASGDAAAAELSPANPITLDEEQRAAILGAMKDVSLEYKPQWAVQLSDQQWNQTVGAFASRPVQETS